MNHSTSTSTTRRRKQLPWAIKTAGWIVAPLALTGVAASAAPTFTSGEVLKASDLSAAFADLQTQIDTLKSASPKVTDWAPYDAVLIGTNNMTVATATDNGNASKGYWRRVGDSVEVRIDFSVQSCPFGSNVGLYATLPPSVALDTTKSGAYAELGGGILYTNAGQAVYAHVIGCNNGAACTSVGLAAYEAAGGATCAAVGTNGIVRVHFSSPVAGWTATM